MIIKDMDHTVNGVTFDIAASFKPYAESTETKQVTLRMLFTDIPLRDVFTKACSSARISWQNGPGRSKFDSWKDRQVVNVNFAAPGVKVKTPEEVRKEGKAAIQMLPAAEQKAMLESMLAQIDDVTEDEEE